MRFNIIGAGRLGKNLALSLVSRGDGELVAVCNRDIHSAVSAVNEVGSGVAVATLTDLPAVDFTFITTPDDNIAGIASQLANPGNIVVHCSGVLSSDVLMPLKKQGSLIASIHPLRAFRDNNIQADAFQDCDCVIEGDDRAVLLLTELFTNMGARVIPINADKKGAYHAAAVMASNYVVTLAGCAVELLIDAGLSEEQARNMTQGLMQSSLANIENTAHVADALTGPLARGDLNTVSHHLNAIKAPDINELYRAAGRATFPLTRLDDETLLAFRKLFNEH